MGAEAILRELTERLPKLEGCREEIRQTYLAWRDCFEAGGKLMICGNGGSQADSMHIVGELMKEFGRRRVMERGFSEILEERFPRDALSGKLQPPLPALALGTNPVLVSAYSNDVAADMVFAQEVYGYGRRGDILFALSTSGNSANVQNALKVAGAMGIRCIGMCGAAACRMTQLCDICIVIPETETYLIQESMLPVYHALCRMAEADYCERCET